MFLRNYYRNLASSLIGKKTTTNVNYNGTSVPTVNDVYAYGFSYWPNGANYEYPCILKIQQDYNVSCGVILGTGDTPPTMDDYCLSGEIIKDFTYSATSTKTIDDNQASISAVYTITNSGSEAFTIREIALKCGASSASQFLVERTVLDTPVTIEPGGVGQVTYTITFTYPSA